MPDRDYDHFCRQAQRIENMDKKIDTITGHFRVDGIVGKMSGNIEKITILAENNLALQEEEEESEEDKIPVKYLVLAILGLIAILATILGVKLPWG
jgi:hypothetical protein